MNISDITITLDNNETYFLGRLVRDRMRALIALPNSDERNDEIVALGSFAAKMAPKVDVRAALERSDER